jgi:hypothetical protein
MKRPLVALVLGFGLLLGACARPAEPPARQDAPRVAVPAATEDTATEDTDTGVTIVVAPSVQGRVNESLVLEAYRRAFAQGEQDFGLRPKQPVTIYIDPDNAIGLEDALGLSAKNAIHLRAGRTQSMNSLLPLMMHEYTHVLQYNVGRLRPQWWIEGQADHQSQRVLDPGRAAQNRRSLLSSLAADVRRDRAPSLASLRGSMAWDEYVKRSGAGKAYGWGNAAVAFIEDGWGFDAVTRIATDATGPNTLSSFDEAIRRETGLDPAAFERELRAWVLQQT